jgi:hypothetical protein
MCHAGRDFAAEIDEEESGSTVAKVAVSDAIQDFVGRLSDRLQDEAVARKDWK